MLCDHLEGWDREGGREGDARGRGYGGICIHIADSLFCTAETKRSEERRVGKECRSRWSPYH